MSRLAGSLLALALLVAISGGAVRLLGDRSLLVAPPDSVAEGFTRSVVGGRWEPARSYLSVDVDDNRLAALRERIETQVGMPTTVVATTLQQDPSHARARVDLTRSGRSISIEYSLEFDGTWKIAGF